MTHDTKLVYTGFVKNITLSADPDLIEKARQVAKAERKTLNAAFREWLASYASRQGDVEAHRALMERLKHINAKGPYTRDEMNER
ncbi:MAG TPA: hypothetical protein VFI60_01845 [Candidatus Acidoferrum sp.]|nr:hypothetical protein [Candidatus Acidoferrum sp.]